MSTYERIKELCEKKGIAQTALEKELGFGRGSIGKLRNGNTTAERLQKIADYFGVSVPYLTTGKEESKENGTEFTPRDERDIARDLENLITKLRNGEDGPASFEGTDIPEADQELFAGQIELMLRRLKVINKEKYNPNKNKK